MALEGRISRRMMAGRLAAGRGAGRLPLLPGLHIVPAYSNGDRFPRKASAGATARSNFDTPMTPIASSHNSSLRLPK
jgi:hypothetical protein